MATPKKILCRGRTYPVRGEMRVRGRQYVIVRQLRGGLPGRLQAVDSKASPGGEMRSINLLPHSNKIVERLTPLVRISEENDCVPTIVEFCPREQDIVVICNWVWGTPLDVYLKNAESGKGKRISPYEATRLFYRFAHGICDLHNRSCVVHGDIKPENLILTRKNRLVLIDFGSAWTLERLAAHDPSDRSSPPYAAPEVLRGQPPKFASEQFSATVLYYRMLTGQIPYDQIGGVAGVDETATDIRPELPSRSAPHMDRTPRRFWKRIDEITTRGLQLDPALRYANASEWLDAIDDLWIAFKTENKVTGRNQLLVNFIQRVGRLFGRSSLLG